MMTRLEESDFMMENQLIFFVSVGERGIVQQTDSSKMLQTLRSIVRSTARYTQTAVLQASKPTQLSASNTGLVVSGAECTSDAALHFFLFWIFFMQMKFLLSLRCRKSKGCQDDSVSPSPGWYPQRCCLA